MPERLRLAAVTGTNGKTTTATMIATIAAAAREPAVSVTSLGAHANGVALVEGAAPNAFPVAARWAMEHRARTVAVEMTSRALVNGFALGKDIAVAVCTNVTQDHLDYHLTLAGYVAAKGRLFEALRPTCVAVLNAFDDHAEALARRVAPGVEVRWFAGAIHPRAILAASQIEISWQGTRITLVPTPLGVALGPSLWLASIGRVYAENALAAAVAATALGYSPAAIRAGLEAQSRLPGRFEVVAEQPWVVVDYAHTPDALERTLTDARVLAGNGKLHVVFGCGGDRDTGKRPLMGKAAARRCDRIWITSDNPRNEDPAAIAQEIVSGIDGGSDAVIELDRSAAIHAAVSAAELDDVVVIAGKGDETTQDLGTKCLPFSDVEVARRAWRSSRPPH